MYMPPAHIHLNENAKPYSRHKPILIPFHCKEEVKKSLGLERDVEIGTSPDRNPSKMVQPNGCYSQEKWKAKENNKPSAPQLPMPQGNTPLPVTFLSSLPVAT